MINCVSSVLEHKTPAIRRLGRKVFDIKELDAHAYLRKNGDRDILTVLDKDYNKLLVQNTKPINANEQEMTTKFFYGGRTITIKSTSKKTNV